MDTLTIEQQAEVLSTLCAGSLSACMVNTCTGVRCPLHPEAETVRECRRDMDSREAWLDQFGRRD